MGNWSDLHSEGVLDMEVKISSLSSVLHLPRENISWRNGEELVTTI
jgi:hypothetical protein